MTDPTIHASPTAGDKAPMAGSNAPMKSGFGVRHRRSFGIVIVIGFIMGVLAPLGTDEIGFWPRLAFWQILMVSGATIGIGVTEAFAAWGRLRPWPWVEAPVIGVLIALPLTMIVIGTGQMFFGAANLSVTQFLYYFGFTALISISITALNMMVNRRDDGMIAATLDVPTMVQPSTVAQIETPVANQPDIATPPFAGPLLADRLPPPLRDVGIVALQAEDHYLRVHFMGGQSALVLMRLSDAMSEFPAHKGAQTHRSWWVARDVKRTVARAEGRATLTLSENLDVPVSRSFYKKLQQDGWFN
jgi:DNA-binding LytR/AlgR family response regulator